MKLQDINIRDPFILPYEGKYYLYGSRVGTPYEGHAWGDQTGFDVYVSDDLENWSEPKPVFEKKDSFWAERDFWAPEVHRYNGKFYLFASFFAEGKCRGTQILVSDSPMGMFEPISEGPATPADWECLDGTFYVDKNGSPHIIFCHEWVQIGDGTVCEVQLSPDLKKAVSEPRMLWKATDYKDVKSVIGEGNFVTDGPFMVRKSEDELYCIWSSFNEGGYAELVCRSDNGDIDGNWSLCEKPMSSEDGGHGMIFKDFSGKYHFIMHKPNLATTERPVIKNLD